MFSQWARNPFKLCKSTQNYKVVQNTGFGASGRRGFTITNICYFAINFLYQNFPQHIELSFKHIYHQHLLSNHQGILHFSIVSCNQLYCVQKKSFSHSSPRCIFLYSVHAGGDPSLFLPLASCAMSRNYVKMGRPTNQVQFMSRQLQFQINLLFLARSECSQCIDEKIWAIISETQKVQQISLKQYGCVSVDGVALFVSFVSSWIILVMKGMWSQS